jgi:hypothetical protein
MGDDGMIFKDCLFDNSRILIDTNDMLTEKGFETQKQQQSVESRRKYLEGLKKDKEETTEISADLG